MPGAIPLPLALAAALLTAAVGVGVACVDSVDELAPFPCAEDGTCPSKLACINGSCVGRALDTLCEADSDCSGLGDEVVCSGVCRKLCDYPGDCPTGQTCQNDHSCMTPCDTASCPSHLECKLSYTDDHRYCLAPGWVFRACRLVAGSQCAFRCGAAYNTVPCGSGHCPELATCTADKKCACADGFSPARCDGTPCSGSACPDKGWSCKRSTAGSPSKCDVSTAGGNGLCDCWDGKSVDFECGETRTCEDICKAAH